MAKPIITLNGLKMVIMLGMLVIILTGIRFAADIIVPFILALFLAVIINPLVQLLVRCRVPRVLAISLLIGLIVMLAIVLLASLGTSLNELARTLPQYRNYLYEPMQTIAPWLQRMGFTVSVVELNKYIDPNAVMTLVTSLLTQLSNAMSSIFLLLLTVVFMLLEVPQLPAKLQQLMSRPVEGMGAIQRAIDSVSHYLVLKTAISLITGLVVWGMLVLLDVRFAFMWGLLAFALNYIPNIGSVLAAIPADPAGTGVWRAVRGAGGPGRLPDRQPGIRQYSRTSYHGARAGPLDAGGIPVLNLLGMVAGSGWHAALGAVDDYRQNCPRADQRRAEYRFLIKRCQ